MRHKFANKKLNRTSEHRKALIKNMLNSLIKYEQIKTTLPKAKVLKPFADKIVSLGKKETISPINALTLTKHFKVEFASLAIKLKNVKILFKYCKNGCGEPPSSVKPCNIVAYPSKMDSLISMKKSIVSSSQSFGSYAACDACVIILITGPKYRVTLLPMPNPMSPNAPKTGGFTERSKSSFCNNFNNDSTILSQSPSVISFTPIAREISQTKLIAMQQTL